MEAESESKEGKWGLEEKEESWEWKEREELNLLDNENENDIVVLNGLCLFGWLSKLSLLRFEA